MSKLNGKPRVIEPGNPLEEGLIEIIQSVHHLPCCLCGGETTAVILIHIDPDKYGLALNTCLPIDQDIIFPLPVCGEHDYRNKVLPESQEALINRLAEVAVKKLRGQK